MKKILLIMAVIIMTLALLIGCQSSTQSQMQIEGESSAEPTNIPVVEAKIEDESSAEPTNIPVVEVSVPLDTAIIEIMNNKLDAIQSKDADAYMSTVGQGNFFYYNEQKSWFHSITEDIMSNVSFEVVSVEMIDEYTGIVNIHQMHMMEEEQFDFEYPMLYKYENGQWLDYGYNFEVYKTDEFMVKYMPGETRVEEFAQYLANSYDYLTELYGKAPMDNYEMKLFYDQELLRQRTYPSNGFLFTGWAEMDESIKLYTGHPAEYNRYPGVIQHELCHHITINMCNNNLSLWLLEGIACYDGNIAVIPDISDMTPETVNVTIEYLEDNNYMIDDLDMNAIMSTYNAGPMYVRYIIETYGRDKLMEIFTEAGKKPFKDSEFTEEFVAANTITTAEAIYTVLGITTEELSENYLEWVQTVDFTAPGHTD